SVPKAASTCATVPEKLMRFLLRETLSTVKPCCSSQDCTLAMSASASPKRAPNSSGVSHLWYRVEVGSCCAVSSACKSASCAGVRLKAMPTPCNWFPGGRRPASSSILAITGCVPETVVRCVSSTTAVMRATGCCAAEEIAKREKASNRPANSSHLRTPTRSRICMCVSPSKRLILCRAACTFARSRPPGAHLDHRGGQNGFGSYAYEQPDFPIARYKKWPKSVLSTDNWYSVPEN